MSQHLMVALYARVSSAQQAKAGTIESQVAALHERIGSDGEQVADDMCFRNGSLTTYTWNLM
jgi:DNA invertase Pin-like site-specific DNA recombinase